ncbi:MAG: TMEM175 family protein [Ktedonobacterales bacterium]
MEQDSPEQDTTPELKETGRIESFSDGVFAVAVTLLILTIQVPPAHNTAIDLPVYVGNQWPFFLAYLVSFLSILVMWANHHGIFNLVVRTDRVMTLLNGVLLMLITFLNYPTAVVAAALRQRAYERFAALFYTGTLVVLTIVYQLFWRYIATHPQLLDRHVDPRIVQKVTREYRFGPLFYLVAFGLAYLNALAGILATLLLAIYFGLTARIAPVHSSASGDHT